MSLRLSILASVAAAIEVGGEGMIGLWLEAEDLEGVLAKFNKSGLDAGPIRKEAGRRVLTIDPKLANQVPLFIFDRKI